MPAPSAAYAPQPALDLPPSYLLPALRRALNTDVQRSAFDLAVQGVNVFPLPHASKKCTWRWAQMNAYRLPVTRLWEVFDGQCNLAVMMGRTSGNLFVIDAETKPTFLYYIRQLRKRGIPVYAVRSGGRKGGGHLYLRCADGEIANIPTGTLKDAEIRGNSCYVLGPGSIHPSTGKPYKWDLRDTGEPPIVMLAQMEWLGVTLRRAQKKLSSRSEYAELSARNRDFVLHGATPNERNIRLFSAACDMNGNGYSPIYAANILTPVARDCGLSANETRATIKSAFSKPREPAKRFSKRTERMPDWKRAETWANNRTWTGHTATTDRIVMLACCDCAKTANEQGVFRAACREIADKVACNKDTAANALRRLVNAGFLIQSGFDRVTGAGLFRLGDETTRSATPDALQNADMLFTHHWNEGRVRILQSVIEADAAEQRALGKTAALLYAAMVAANRPLTRKQWAAVAHLTYCQVCRALQRLMKFGLVAEREGTFCALARTTAELEEQVARPAGTLGKGDERRRKHRYARMMRLAEFFIDARGVRRGKVARANGRFAPTVSAGEAVGDASIAPTAV